MTPDELTAVTTSAERALHQLIRDLLDEAAHAGQVRDDIPPAELATYCLHALNAAASADSAAAIHRLLALTGAAIQPPADPICP